MKVLIVDDDADLNRMLSLFLEKNGFEIHSAGDALQALDILDRVPDLGFIITDLMMPHLDGMAFIELVRQRLPSVPIILITAYADDRKADSSMRKGAAFFLSKPIDFNRLLTLLRFAE